MQGWVFLSLEGIHLFTYSANKQKKKAKKAKTFSTPLTGQADDCSLKAHRFQLGCQFSYWFTQPQNRFKQEDFLKRTLSSHFKTSFISHFFAINTQETESRISILINHHCAHASLFLENFCMLNNEITVCTRRLERAGRQRKSKDYPTTLEHPSPLLETDSKENFGCPNNTPPVSCRTARIAQPDAQPGWTSIFEHKSGSVSTEIFPLLRSTGCKAVP